MRPVVSLFHYYYSTKGELELKDMNLSRKFFKNFTTIKASYYGELRR